MAAHPHGQPVRRVACLLGSGALVLLLLDSAGLAGWARRLPLGPTHDLAVACTEPLERIDRAVGLGRPRAALHRLSRQAMGLEEASGWGPSESESSPPAESSPESLPVEPARPIYSPQHPLQALLVGDSLIGDGFGVPLEEAMRHDPALRVFRQCTVSSGLSRPDCYSWPKQAAALIETHRPAVIVGIIGINDVQGVYRDGKVLQFGDPAWFEAYEALATEFLDLLADHSEMLYWVALPPMRDNRLREPAVQLNEVFERVCARRSDIRFIPTRGLLGDGNGLYTAYLTIDGKRVLARSGDGIHISRAAGKLMADEVLARIEQDFDLRRDAAGAESSGAPAG